MSTRQEHARNLVVNNPRKAGGLFLLIGSGLLYTNALKPLQDAEDAAQSLTISEKMVTLGILGLVFGLALIIGGGRITRFTHPAPGESRTPAIIIVTIPVRRSAAGAFTISSNPISSRRVTPFSRQSGGRRRQGVHAAFSTPDQVSCADAASTSASRNDRSAVVALPRAAIGARLMGGPNTEDRSGRAAFGAA